MWNNNLLNNIGIFIRTFNTASNTSYALNEINFALMSNNLQLKINVLNKYRPFEINYINICNSLLGTQYALPNPNYNGIDVCGYLNYHLRQCASAVLITNIVDYVSHEKLMSIINECYYM